MNHGYSLKHDAPTGLWVLYKDLRVVRWFTTEIEAKSFLAKTLNLINSAKLYNDSKK